LSPSNVLAWRHNPNSEPMKHTWLLLMALMTLLAGCEYNKYTEGPTTSIFPAKDRVTRTWTWKLAEESGENLTGFLRDSTIVFDADQTVRICPDGSTEGCRVGEWALVTKNTKLNIIFGEQARAYDILLLKKNEMWLQFQEDNVDVYWELEPGE